MFDSDDLIYRALTLCRMLRMERVIGTFSFNPHDRSVPGDIIIPGLQMGRLVVMLIMKMAGRFIPSRSAPSPAMSQTPVQPTQG